MRQCKYSIHANANLQAEILFANDALYFTALTLGKIVANEGEAQLTNGTLFHAYASNTHFEGVSGHVAMDVIIDEFVREYNQL